ncbi:MAG: PAS domain S-box protein, partial [Candidatus Aegiribacteria sp.]|nr:PAS domain S-box protein [Candidatus Aegiribacteria sp.]
MPEKPAREELEQRIRELENAESENRHELEALRESEAMFRFLTESMSDIIWTVDMDFNTTYVSPSIENVLGFTPEERKNQSPEEMVTPESLKSIKKLLNKEYIKDKLRSKDRERSITAMTEYYMKSGGTLWLENHVRWIRDEKGKIIGIHGISRDITARRQAEKA